MFPSDEEIIAVMMLMEDVEQDRAIEQGLFAMGDGSGRPGSAPAGRNNRPDSAPVGRNDRPESAAVARNDRQGSAAEARRNAYDQRGRPRAQPPRRDAFNLQWGANERQAQNAGEINSAYLKRVFLGTTAMGMQYGCTFYRTWPTTNVEQTIRPYEKTKCFFHGGDMINLHHCCVKSIQQSGLELKTSQIIHIWEAG